MTALQGSLSFTALMISLNSRTSPWALVSKFTTSFFFGAWIQNIKSFGSLSWESVKNIKGHRSYLRWGNKSCFTYIFEVSQVHVMHCFSFSQPALSLTAFQYLSASWRARRWVLGNLVSLWLSLKQRLERKGEWGAVKCHFPLRTSPFSQPRPQPPGLRRPCCSSRLCSLCVEWSRNGRWVEWLRKMLLPLPPL